MSLREHHDTADVQVGVLLAGGASRRMGRDKRTLRIDGRTLVERNLELLLDAFPTVAISLRQGQHLEPPPPPGVAIVYDSPPESPLAGIAAALERFGGPVFVLASDLVAPQPSAIERVVAAFTETDLALPAFRDHVEPLHAVYGPRCLPVAQALLSRGEHSILELFPHVRVRRVAFDSEDPFFNVNTPEEWAKATGRRAPGREPE